MRSKTYWFLCLCLATGILTSAVAAQSKSHELWRGPFTQKTPLPWTGPMELFIRYDEEDEYPQPIEGIITWRGLSQAQTKISGERTRSGIRFKELQCVQGGCGSIVVGGEYEASYREGSKKLKGSAELKSKGLSGSFELERVD